MNDMSEFETRAAAAGRGWQSAIIAWVVVAATILVLLRKDVAHIFDLWWNTDTFGHCLLIPPILAYLVWQRRSELAVLTPRPWYPAAILMLIGGAGWLVGEASGVALLRHTAVVGLLIVSVPLVFGLTVSRGLAFVLFFALFMIPAGEELVPILQTLTAAICIKLLEWSGIPAFIDGVFIAIPNGSFEVAEACSGVRFLIAMIAFSVLVAHLCFKRWTRRILFVLSAIALSILANGIRAFGTIYISHLTTPGFAAGVDHIIYGWIFFAIVMFLLVAAGWPFFDRPVDDPAFDPAQLQPAPPAPAAPRAVATAAAIGIVAMIAGPLYGFAVANRDPDTVTASIALPDVPGWQRIESGPDWQPHYKGVSAQAIARYVDGEGQPVDLYIGVFDRQTEDGELVGYKQGLLPPETDWSWARNEKAPPGGRAQQIKNGGTVRDNWQFLLVNGKLTGSDYVAKIEGLKSRLLGGETLAGTLVISADRRDELVSAMPVIERFAKALGPVDTAIETATVER
ncbi:exosortase A [Sphingosinicella soli]|uniref:Exosortase A n=1 Tax=Sphingosinicella soli TaxID=333708 RepID=A0A7W7AYM7_9SPHN|nr:exosortase A [Sphingosinicella soli]MBB4630659.1 exosortase A [Sphingosinicella soli]